MLVASPSALERSGLLMRTAATGSVSLRDRTKSSQHSLNLKESRANHCTPQMPDDSAQFFVRSLFVPMKRCVSIFCVFLALCASVCGQQRSVEERLSDVEKRVSALEKASPLSLAKPPPSPTPAAQTKSPLELVSWSGEYSQHFYTITLNLKNNADKDIKLIDASVYFYDLQENQVFGIKVNPERSIPAGQVIAEKGDYSVNESSAEQVRMAQMKKEDIKATLVVQKLVFVDNSTGEY